MSRDPLTVIADHTIWARMLSVALVLGALTLESAASAGLCARAASGHAAATPPSSVMKSRRFTHPVSLVLLTCPIAQADGSIAIFECDFSPAAPDLSVDARFLTL